MLPSTAFSADAVWICRCSDGMACKVISAVDFSPGVNCSGEALAESDVPG